MTAINSQPMRSFFFLKTDNLVRSSCSGADRRLRRKQGGEAGAAASEMRVPLKARSSCWEPQPVLRLWAQRLMGSFAAAANSLPQKETKHNVFCLFLHGYSFSSCAFSWWRMRFSRREM